MVPSRFNMSEAVIRICSIDRIFSDRNKNDCTEKVGEAIHMKTHGDINYSANN